jgi:hypothetical protein
MGSTAHPFCFIIALKETKMMQDDTSFPELVMVELPR